MCKHGIRILILLLCLIDHTVLAQENEMSQGIDAFNDGEYSQALDHFLAAESQGTESASLTYNIGVTLYRLERYGEARTRLMTLEPDPQWTPLVHYNYGLIAEAMGDRAAAIRWFTRASQQQDQPRIRDAASRKLDTLREAAETERVTSRSQPEERTPAFSLVSLSAGRDSNASTLSDEFVQSSSAREDNFTEILAYTRGYARGRQNDGIRLYGLFFTRLFEEFSNLDAMVYGGGVAREKPLWDLQTDTELRITQTRLDGDLVANEFRLKLGAGKQLEIGRLEADYYASYFSAGDRFSQVEGTRNRLDLTWSKNVAPLTYSIRYRYENNNRDNLSRSNGAFSSYSPTRNRLRGEIDWRVSDKWSAGISYEYIDDKYDGINRLRDADGTVKTTRRKRSMNLYQFDLNYRLDRHWRFTARAERTVSDDVFTLYTYDKNRYLATVEYRFE